MQDQSKEKAEKLKQKEKELEERIHATQDKLYEKEIRKHREVDERKVKNKIRNSEQEMRIRKEVAEERRAERSRRHAELTNLAAISMDRAIQVATSQYPGKVLACSLGRDAEGRVPYPMMELGVRRNEYVTRLGDYEQLQHLLDFLLPIGPEAA